MIKSMTGYGKSELKIGSDHYTIEIHSVNKKSLDMHINLPKEFLSFDIEMRKWVHEVIERGQVTLRVCKEGSFECSESLPSFESLKTLKTHWEKYAKMLGFSSEEVTFKFLAEQMMNFPKLPCFNLDEVRLELKKGFKEAISAYNKMREEEGKSLEKELEDRLAHIKKSLDVLEKQAPSSSLAMKKKLEDKLKEAHLLSQDGEDRLQRELILYAEKMDYTEEIVRLSSHIHQFQKSLKTLRSGLGKTLEFLTLEMNRETHTIASKSQDLGVTKEALFIKIELEKIREQVQNIQ